MTSLSTYSNGTEDAIKNPAFSSFYGPGAWAAWCITLIASWAPILRDDYTHNLHFITYAMYTNWAAIDYFQYTSLKWRLEDLGSSLETLRLQIPEPELPGMYDMEEDFDIEKLKSRLKTTLKNSSGNESSLTPPQIWILEHWQDLMTGTEEEVVEQRARYERRTQRRQLLTRLDTQRLAYIKAWNQVDALWDQSRAALAVLNLGTLHACVQLLVCARKTTKATSNDRVKAGRRRCWIIFIGTFLFVGVLGVDMIHTRHRQGMPVGLIWPTLLTIFILTMTTYNPHLYNFPAPLSSHLGSLVTRVFRSLCALVFVFSWAHCLGALVAVLTLKTWTKGKCLFVPCTPVRIAELDQAFALSVALLCVLYEFGSLFLEGFKFL